MSIPDEQALADALLGHSQANDTLANKCYPKNLKKAKQGLVFSC